MAHLVLQVHVQVVLGVAALPAQREWEWLVLPMENAGVAVLLVERAVDGLPVE